MGSRPKVANLAKINAPNGNVPSTDKSGKSNILYVINTPIANTANMSPCSIDIVINEFIFYPFFYCSINSAPSKTGSSLFNFKLFIVFTFTTLVVLAKVSTGISSGFFPSTSISLAIRPVCLPNS